MSKLPCTSSKRIVDYISGGLSNQSRLKLESHLKECRICYEELDSYSELSLGVSETIRSLKVNDENHLDNTFLQRLAKGEVDFSSIHQENDHLIGCEICWRQLKEFEQKVIKELKNISNEIFYYSADHFYSEEERLAADTESRLSFDFRSLSSVRSLVSCRQFQLELFCHENGIFLCLWTDYPDEVNPIELKSSKVSPKLIKGESKKSCRLFFLGSIDDLLHQLVEVCFELNDNKWCKKIFFGPVPKAK